jgi:ribonuclease HII
MTWIVGIDEAGYGPNLGPLVMSAVACQAPDPLAEADLWEALHLAVRRHGTRDDRLLVDDSKVVHANRGVAGLERGLLATLGPTLRGPPANLAGLLSALCIDGGDLCAEAWYVGDSPVPGHTPPDQVAEHAARFTSTCAAAGLGRWLARSVVICPPRFNALLDRAGSKGAVLADGLIKLIRSSMELTAGEEGVSFFIDKHGGRNAYAAQVQHALPGRVVVAAEEGLARSAYRVLGPGRPVRLTFQPRADSEHFCVALASMASKYLREALMGEFNSFWQKQVPGLKATAGYPGDAPRFLEAIRPAARRLGIAEEAIWRRK